MRAIRLHATGGPENLRFEELPDPAPAPGQLCVRVEAAGVNFIDTYHRRGLYPVALPRVLGGEVAGIVTAVGTGVVGF
jgi:NADPH2:quinone reductase